MCFLPFDPLLFSICGWMDGILPLEQGKYHVSLTSHY